MSHGAREIDTVIPLALLKDHRYPDLYQHLSAIVSAASPYPTKVILETVFLSHEEIVAACVVAKAAGALWVKTSTGFLGGGADETDVKVMWKAIRGDNANGQQVHVKASGGVRTFDACLKMLRAGAERIGTCVLFLLLLTWIGTVSLTFRLFQVLRAWQSWKKLKLRVHLFTSIIHYNISLKIYVFPTKS